MSDKSGDPPADVPRPNGGSREVLFHPEVDDILENLSNNHRRAILYLLKEEEIDTLEDVLRHEGTETEVNEIELIHQHLPKLQDANYIEFEPESGTLSEGSDFDRVVPLLELVEQNADELPVDWP